MGRNQGIKPKMGAFLWIEVLSLSASSREGMGAVGKSGRRGGGWGNVEGGGEGCGGEWREGRGLEEKWREEWRLRDKAVRQICLSGPEWVLPAQKKGIMMG